MHSKAHSIPGSPGRRGAGTRFRSVGRGSRASWPGERVASTYFDLASTSQLESRRLCSKRLGRAPQTKLSKVWPEIRDLRETSCVPLQCNAVLRIAGNPLHLHPECSEYLCILHGYVLILDIFFYRNLGTGFQRTNLFSNLTCWTYARNVTLPTINFNNYPINSNCTRLAGISSIRYYTTPLKSMWDRKEKQ